MLLRYVVNSFTSRRIRQEGALVVEPTSLGARIDLHHVGVSVDDMDRSLAFWRAFMGVEPTSRRVVGAEFIGTLVGYPGVELEIAWLDLDGMMLELARFVGRHEAGVDSSPARPGVVHLCLGVSDLDEAFARAIAAGAQQVSVEPITIPSGPNEGARHVYFRDPDGVLIELRQAPSG
jgi:catechol 2,3-dioxygenase-like lactoylglutathione lyase family enzyme